MAMFQDPSKYFICLHSALVFPVDLTESLHSFVYDKRKKGEERSGRIRKR